MNSSCKTQLSWISNISIKLSFLYYYDVRKGAKGTQNKTFIDSQRIHKQTSQSGPVDGTKSPITMAFLHRMTNAHQASIRLPNKSSYSCQDLTRPDSSSPLLILGTWTVSFFVPVKSENNARCLHSGTQHILKLAVAKLYSKED